MSVPNEQLVIDAVARNAALVLSLPSAGLLRNHKSRFLGECEEGLWVESAAGEQPLIQELLVSRQPAGVAFRSGPQKVVFTSMVCRFSNDFSLNDGVVAAALLLARPDVIKTIQRRANYRVAVTEYSGLSIRVWRLPERVYLLDRPMAAQALVAELRDLSIGGMGVIFHPKDGAPPKVTTEERLRIEFKYQEESFIVEGRCRSGQPVGDGLRTGIAFRGLEKDLDGRRKLTQLARIIGEFQRDEVRRARIGV